MQASRESTTTEKSKDEWVVAYLILYTDGTFYGEPVHTGDLESCQVVAENIDAVAMPPNGSNKIAKEARLVTVPKEKWLEAVSESNYN